MKPVPNKKQILFGIPLELVTRDENGYKCGGKLGEGVEHGGVDV